MALHLTPKEPESWGPVVSRRLGMAAGVARCAPTDPRFAQLLIALLTDWCNAQGIQATRPVDAEEMPGVILLAQRLLEGVTGITEEDARAAAGAVALTAKEHPFWTGLPAEQGQ